MSSDARGPNAHELTQFRETQTSLVGLIYWVGYRRRSFPYQRRAREHGSSAWTLARKVRYLLDSVYAFTDLPVLLLQVVGLVGFVISCLLGIVIFAVWLAGGIPQPGYTPMMIILLASTSALLMGLGVVGSYVARGSGTRKRDPSPSWRATRCLTMMVLAREPESRGDRPVRRRGRREHDRDRSHLLWAERRHANVDRVHDRLRDGIVFSAAVTPRFVFSARPAAARRIAYAVWYVIVYLAGLVHGSGTGEHGSRSPACRCVDRQRDGSAQLPGRETAVLRACRARPSVSDYFVHPAAICKRPDRLTSRIWAFAHVLPGARIGRDCNICDDVFIENDVVVGDRVTIKSGVQLWDGMRLGDDVFVGPNVTFTNDKYPGAGSAGRCGRTAYGWGIDRRECDRAPGAGHRPHAMVGAGSVVTKDVPPNAIVSATPRGSAATWDPRRVLVPGA